MTSAGRSSGGRSTAATRGRTRSSTCASHRLTYATDIRTPLLIQHSERDLRTPITQAEELFTVLRSLKREVRLMRVPDETHELTRSGTPFRRVANLDEISRWFEHYLVERRRGLPPIRSIHPRSSAKAAPSAK